MVNAPEGKVDGLIFDKDGTLFDFHASWSGWAIEVIGALAGQSAGLTAALADAMDFDHAAGRFRPTSPIIAGTNRETVECVARVIHDRDIAELEEMLATRAARAALVPPVPLAPLLGGLRDRGLVLGVVTNDSAVSVQAHLCKAGIEGYFDFVAGFDSGFGAKPAADPLLAFAGATGLAPARVAMVGDSTHDLLAGRAAGMTTLAVLTGPAARDDLAPLADAVLDHVGHLPAWLDA